MSSLKRNKGRSRLRRVSKKREIENVAYIIAKEQWREKRINEDGFIRCQFKGQPLYHATDEEGRCCATASDSPHHRKGRGKWLAYPRFFLALCVEHHRWTHDHAREARKRKYLLF